MDRVLVNSIHSNQYFIGERVQSLGKDWHRACLRCYNESCKKTLASGSHSEVRDYAIFHSGWMEFRFPRLPTETESYERELRAISLCL